MIDGDEYGGGQPSTCWKLERDTMSAKSEAEVGLSQL